MNNKLFQYLPLTLKEEKMAVVLHTSDRNLGAVSYNVAAKTTRFDLRAVIKSGGNPQTPLRKYALLNFAVPQIVSPNKKS